MAVLNNSNAITTSGAYDINNSLRFRSSASAYLSRTPASAGNRTTWTWSAWVKRGAADGAGAQMLFGVNTGAGSYSEIRTLSDKFCFQDNSFATEFQTNAVLRDYSAWYHLMFVIDTTQATSTNRIKAYINGVEQTFAAGAYPSQNATLTMNTTNAHNIGRRPTGVSYFDGYIAEQYFIDGSAKTPSDFGETDATTGSWKPKAYTGTYGTNGFYLKFSDIATTSGSNAGLGKDFSGNANYWTTNNISVTAGSTYDAMTDSPTLTSATVGNYCVLNAASIGADATLSNANLTIAYGTSVTRNATMGTFGMSSGKWYWEYTIISASPGGPVFGITNTASASAVSNYPGFAANGWGYAADGSKYNAGTGTAYGASYATNDILGVAFDADTGSITFYKNNTSQGVAFSSLAADTYFPAFGDGSGTGTLTGAVNFGQRPFTYTPPTGYVALNTYNLPDSTIKKGNTVMDATLYTGNGSTQTITNASGFKPDLVWNKGRSSAVDNCLTDSNRGANKQLVSNTTGAELTYTNQVTAFNSNGFSLGADNLGYSNFSGVTYVGWQWQAGQGTNTTNTSGSITSTVSVSTTAGFSVVTYTGTGANATVGHGLGVAPKMYIVKGRSAVRDWFVYSSEIGNTKYLNLNNTNASTTFNVWQNTSPTSNVLYLSNSTDVNGSGVTYVAYCWAEIAGFSKFGSYTGNGSSDGTFVYTGFRPKFVMIKQSSSSGAAWVIYDTARGIINPTNIELYPTLSNAESSGSNFIDILSNGFKLRSSETYANGSGSTYIYMAFAENPFKNANAR